MLREQNWGRIILVPVEEAVLLLLLLLTEYYEYAIIQQTCIARSLWETWETKEVLAKYLGNRAPIERT